jgi:hypothetical protein
MLNVPMGRRVSQLDRTSVSKVLEALVDQAEWLDLYDRLTVGSAMSEVGWVTSHPTEIVNAVLRSTAQIEGGTGPCGETE